MKIKARWASHLSGTMYQHIVEIIFAVGGNLGKCGDFYRGSANFLGKSSNPYRMIALIETDAVFQSGDERVSIDWGGEVQEFTSLSEVVEPLQP